VPTAFWSEKMKQKRDLETKRMWEDNIKKYRKDIGHADVA